MREVPRYPDDSIDVSPSEAVYLLETFDRNRILPNLYGASTNEELWNFLSILDNSSSRPIVAVGRPFTSRTARLLSKRSCWPKLQAACERGR